MMVQTGNIRSLTEFRRNAKDHLDRIARTGEPEVLTVNGEARGVLLSPASYDKLIADAEYAKNLRAIRNGLEDLHKGDTVPAEFVLEQVRKIIETDREA